MDKKLAINGGKAEMAGWKFPAWPQYGKGEADALLRTLNSGVWGIGGSETAAFEKSFGEFTGCKHCVTMVNGSVTLRNALLACGVEAGAEVIVPPYTFLATASAVLEANCVPVFADIDPVTFCLDPASVEAAITKNTKVIIPVHLGGHPAQMDKLMAIAAKHGLKVIEDAAHAHGSEFKGKRAGSLGDVASFSFQSSKNLCCGEGGAITSNDDAIAEMCWSIHNCGRTRTGAWYAHENLGGNYRLSQFSAAILNEQFKSLPAQIAKRQANADYLDSEISKIPGLKPQGRSKDVTVHARHIYIFTYDKAAFGGVSREKFLEACKAEGLTLSAGYINPLYKMAFFKNKRFASFTSWKQVQPGLSYDGVFCKNAEKLASETGCWLAQSPLLGERSDMDSMIRVFHKVYDNRAELLG